MNKEQIENLTTYDVQRIVAAHSDKIYIVAPQKGASSWEKWVLFGVSDPINVTSGVQLTLDEELASDVEEEDCDD
jgi:hypothetical protein